VGKVEKTCPSSEKKKSTKRFSKKAEIFHAQSLRFYSQRQSARALETRLIVLNKKIEFIEFYKRNNLENGKKPRGQIENSYRCCKSREKLENSLGKS